MAEFRDEVDRLKDVERERDSYMRRIAQISVEKANGMDHVGTSIGAAKKKSSKIPDPPTLTDGKEPRFDDWLLLMNQKLRANGDHFDSPELRIAYVASRCDGKARRHITPRMREEAGNPYGDSKDMLDHLKTIYEAASRLGVINHRIQKNRNFGPATKPEEPSIIKTEPATPEPRRVTHNTGNDLRDKLLSEGRCFNCHEQGHMAATCPRKQQDSSNLRNLEGSLRLPPC